MIFCSAFGVALNALSMSRKNVILLDSAIALTIAILRVINNQAYSSYKNINLGKAVINAHQGVLEQQIWPVIAHLANEDEMPGKLFCLAQENL